MAKKKNSNVTDLMARLGASLKESPIKAHKRQDKSAPTQKAPQSKIKKKREAQPSAQKAVAAAAQSSATLEIEKTQNIQKQDLQQVVQTITAPSQQNWTAQQPQKQNRGPSYRGWKTSTVGLYPEDYQKARDAMNYIQEQTGENTNLSRVVKIALRALEIGPQVLEVNQQIKSKDGRLVSRRFVGNQQ